MLKSLFFFVLLGCLIPFFSAEKYSFPDGSKYRGEVLDGAMHGLGEYIAANGEYYKGNFKNNLYHGEGTFIDTDGNALQSTFLEGAPDGKGVYTYSDGRAEVAKYAEGKEMGLGCRWSPCRLRAWRLRDGELDGDMSAAEISLTTAQDIADDIGVQVPKSIYALGLEAMHSLEKHIAEGNSEAFEGMVEHAFGGESGHLVAHSRRPLVSAKECEFIINECEARARAVGGWTTKRHAAYPTTDVPVQKLPGTMRWLTERLLPDIAYPFLAAAYHYALPHELDGGHRQCGLQVVDAFIVKYNATAGQRELLPHRDGAVFSFNIALNGLDEYEGGGTVFRLLPEKAAIRSPKGHILSHSSSLVHAGAPVVSGVRYLLVCFVSVDPQLRAWAASFVGDVTRIDPDPIL